MVTTAISEAGPEQIDWIIAEINQRGYCVVEGLLLQEQVNRIRVVLEDLLNSEKKQNIHPTGHQRVLHLAAKHPVFLEPLCHPLIIAVWRKYLSSDLICSTFTANALWPQATEQYWHADHPYWTLAPPYPEIPLTGQCIFFIDEFTERNGATAGIPGSHRANVLPHMGERWTDEAEILTGPSGSVIFAHGAWWHTSRPNRTDKLRSALLATYTHTFCVPQEEMRTQLSHVNEPSELVKQLLGGNQYQPTRGFPY
ncbi:MAG: phytanoyl-CoA dioxygenase family protein [Pseudonocardiaceae bacterium]